MNYLEIIKNRYVQLVSCFAIGAAVGVIFYPQSRTEERMKLAYENKETELRASHRLELTQAAEDISKEEATHKEYREETSKKLDKLTVENSTLKQSMKKQKLKIVRPDGTIIEKEVEESNSESTKTVITEIREEFDRKVSSIENKWKKIHEERISSIKKEFDEKLEKAKSENKVVEKEKIVEKNSKKLRTELGYTSKKDYYNHNSYTLWGPVFMGAGLSGTEKDLKEVHAGIGIEF